MGGHESISEGDLANFHTLSIEDVENLELRQRISAAINLMENIHRGTVAEVLVAMALDGTITDAWSDWDVTLEDGTRVEVKTTGPIQAWPQTKPSAPIWSVARSEGWGTDGAAMVDPALERRSDLYVFAIHDGVRPDDSAEWRFYVIPTEGIDRVLADQKTVTESSLVRLFGTEPLTYHELSRMDARRR